MKQYQPLYLKYRPQKLSEVIGQEVVTKTLFNAILYNKIVHAYLFCGPRGTGKTSTARILAKSLNCEKEITANPCGQCLSCKSITVGNSLDVIEIDAASHRKVEDVEDLINRVSLATYGSRFKIYIIDEVHMLTDHAFNALLKTLEEPPKNVIFILATTEEYKVIPTIISRCQKLEFKAVSQVEIGKRIKNIAENEKINIDDSIISFISRRASGCLRDAVSLLDQISVVQTEDKQIKASEVFELFGTVDRSSLFNLLEAVLTFDRQKTIELAEELIKSGKDIGELFKSLVEMVIDLAKAKLNSLYRESLSSELNNPLNIVEKIQQTHLLKIIDKLQEGQSRLRFALSQELQFMVEIMGMVDEDFLVSLKELKERIEKLEGKKQEPLPLPKETRNIEITDLKPMSETKDQKMLVDSLPTTGGSNDSESLILASQSFELSREPLSTGQVSNLDLVWSKIISFIDSNPTKTLLNQSDCYLLSLTADLIEVGVSKDMFLPRLEKDEKKKEMLLKAAKLASGFSPASIRFKLKPRQLVKNEIETTGNGLEGNSDKHSELQPSVSQPAKTNLQENKVKNDPNEDEFSRTVKDLLGAKQIE